MLYLNNIDNDLFFIEDTDDNVIESISYDKLFNIIKE